MHELRYVTTENGYVILENASEERFRVEITDAMREASRLLVASSAPRPTSPKEIQTLYRSGKTEQEIAKLTGENLEFIQMFTPAVQTELDYVTERLQTTEFVFGNRMAPFSEIVSLSFSNPIWESYKISNTWFVRVSQAGQQATWKYDPKISLLEPQNDLAHQISAAMQDAMPIDLIISNTTDAPAELANHVTPTSSPESDSAAVELGQDAEVLTLLDEIRERRAIGSVPTHSELRDEVVEASSQVEILKQDSTPKPSIAKGRAALPSWDEIIFGTSSDS